MDKKKILVKSFLIIGIIVIIATVIILVNSNKDKSPTIVSKPINNTVNLENVFEKIEQIEGIEIQEEIVNENIPEEEIDFKEYAVLDKKAIVNTNDEKINEVWMIKLGNYEQQEDVCRILGNRVQKLKNAFSENAEQMQILNNAVIKQEDGIVIMILSPYANQIEETIANEM